jgi:monosaccharide-transporting ATPase
VIIMLTNVILQADGVHKAFPGVKALNAVDFKLRKGEIHALMGENGAGKSTLIKVLTGVHERDAGVVTLNGREIHPRSTLEAQKLGISTVYQEVNLCANLTVAENIFIGRQPRRGGRLDWKEMNIRSEELLRRLELKIDVGQTLSSYSVAIQQMVAIARAVDISSGVLILDEPTSSLDKNEVKQLFTVMRKLREEGMGIVFVTHFLDQVYEVSDRITVLRNGSLIGEYLAAELPRTQLVSRMIGRDLDKQEAADHHGDRKAANRGETLLELLGLGRKGSVEPLDLTIRKGEIMGLAGLLGSGRSEIARLIFGIDRHDEGVMEIDGMKIGRISPSKAIRKGIGFCPEDRKVQGIVGPLTIRENIILALQANRGFFKYIPLKRQREIAEKYIEMLRIKTPSMEQRIDNLSGGNQQKVILARWLATEPRLLILDEPTRGIDVGSKEEIRKLIRSLAADGISILFISSELEEMTHICDRIVILRDRIKVGEIQGDTISEQEIMKIIAEGAVISGGSQTVGA